MGEDNGVKAMDREEYERLRTLAKYHYLEKKLERDEWDAGWFLAFIVYLSMTLLPLLIIIKLVGG